MDFITGGLLGVVEEEGPPCIGGLFFFLKCKSYQSPGAFFFNYLLGLMSSYGKHARLRSQNMTDGCISNIDHLIHVANYALGSVERDFHKSSFYGKCSSQRFCSK